MPPVTRLILRFALPAVGLALYLMWHIWTNRPSPVATWAVDHKVAMLPVVKKHTGLKTGALPAAELSAVKGRRVLLARNGQAYPLSKPNADPHADPEVPGSLARTPGEVGVLVFISEDGSRERYAFLAITVPEPQVVARWVRPGQHGAPDDLALITDVEALYAGRAPAGAELGSALAQAKDDGHVDPGSLELKGYAAKSAGRFDEAAGFYAQAAAALEQQNGAITRRCRALQFLATCQREGGHPADAAATWVKAADLDPDPTAQQVCLNEAVLAYGDTDDAAHAVETLERLKALRAKNVPTPKHLEGADELAAVAKAQLAAGLVPDADRRSASAVKLVDEALAPELHAQVLEVRAAVLATKGQAAEAEKLRAKAKTLLEE